MKAELEINQEEKLAQRIIPYKQTSILDSRKYVNKNKLINNHFKLANCSDF